ncbi:MAG: hypothetical protein EOO38_31115, partial [Cytophagaceae bacterium]
LGKAQFDALPAKIRDRFNNDPSRFLAFCENPENEAELVQLGLRDAKPEEPPAPAPAVPSKSNEDAKSTASKS